jgi:hypothetical protein
MSDILPPIEPETSGQVTQLDAGHSGDVFLKVALVLVVGLIVAGFWWLFNSRNGGPTNKLKLTLTKFRSLFKNEWTWRLFMVFQIAGLLGIAYLTIANENNWHLFPYTRWTGETVWDFCDSLFWTEYHENWLVIVFLIGPFFMAKSMDWVSVAKKKPAPLHTWKNN